MDNNTNETKINLAIFLKAAAVFLVLVGLILGFTIFKIMGYRKQLSEQLKN